MASTFTFTTPLTDLLERILVTIQLRPNHKTCYASIARDLYRVIRGLKEVEFWETGKRQARMKEEDMDKLHVYKEKVAKVQQRADELLEKHDSSSCHRTEVGQEILNLDKEGHKLLSYVSMQWQAVICNPAIRQELLMEDILQGMTEEQRKDAGHLELVWTRLGELVKEQAPQFQLDQVGSAGPSGGSEH
ncbi:hypothetical protein DXG01_014460 [Tephrocybe rancida]|nr:hypothetical protein DXG01_014460 [Tephrocybe rancida]